MLQAGFLSETAGQVSHKETHISHLFFADELVYKVKKAVRYSFLDYSTLEKRRYFLQEELRLNRRLAPSVYIDVLPIAFDDLGWRLGGWAEPAEYTLVMRRLPDKRMLPFLLDTGQVTAAMMRELAELLARFHTDAERVTGIDPDRYSALVQAQWNDNLADLARESSQVIDPENCHAIEKFGAEFFLRHCRDSQTARGKWMAARCPRRSAHRTCLFRPGRDSDLRLHRVRAEISPMRSRL